jgi:hypothetical protein
MYRIRQRRTVPVVEFPQLCAPPESKPSLDYSKLDFVDDEPVIQERRIPYGWVRLYFENHQVKMETDYFYPETSLDEVAGTTILTMKKRWYNFYTDRDLEPYDYDYIPEEEEDYETASSSSWSAEDPEEFSD